MKNNLFRFLVNRLLDIILYISNTIFYLLGYTCKSLKEDILLLLLFLNFESL